MPLSFGLRKINNGFTWKSNNRIDKTKEGKIDGCVFITTEK